MSSEKENWFYTQFGLILTVQSAGALQLRTNVCDRDRSQICTKEKEENNRTSRFKKKTFYIYNFIIIESIFGLSKNITISYHNKLEICKSETPNL